MKEGWECKKLSDVGTVVTGSTPSTKDADNYNSCDVCFVKPSDIPKDGIGILSDTEFHISNKAYDKSRKLPIGSVLTTCIGIVGKVGILKVEATCNQQINAIIPNTNIVPSFLAYSILSKKQSLEKTANAPVVPIINKKDFSNTTILVPPLSEQQHIVDELDLLSSIIEKKKAQLNELDNLAQSLFYEMFGDPITNDKGWEVKKIGEIGSVERGAGISKKDFVDNGLPCIHYGQLHTIFGPTTFRNKTYIPADLLPKYKIAHPGDVIMAITSEDVEGSCKSTAWLGNFDVVVGSDAAIFHHSINGVYISYYTMTKAFYNEKAKYANGFKVTHISAKEIESIPIPLPPMDLQNQFAKSIEDIEHQKELIKQSIKEVETLFNSRMDYYFN